MKKLLSIILLGTALQANNSTELNQLADINTWNKNNINKLLSLQHIDTSTLTDKSYKNIQLELEKCSKRNYNRCSVNTFKLRKFGVDNVISSKIDKTLRNLSKEVNSHRKSIQKENKKVALLEKKNREEVSKKARLEYKEKQNKEILKAGYKGVKSIIELYSDLSLSQSFYKKKDYIFKANNNFEFVALVDNFAIFAYMYQNSLIYITIDREKKMYSADSYIYGETFVFNDIKEFQGQNGIIQTIYLKNKVFYTSN